ncbi:MAG: microcin C ABC transporter permease YejB [Acidiferrobacterales bacterium]|nr:microcin C ABC transporter permease YejB [Acidiferrobacterales bacterium]
MLAYILRRLLLVIPTLFGIMIINFAIIQFAPGGPVEQAIAEWQGQSVDATSRFSGTGSDIQGGTSEVSGGQSSGGVSKYRGAQGLRPEIIAEIEKQYGFDRPAHERFFNMMWDYARFDFGESYFSNKRVVDLVLEKMPVSISLGLWTTIIVYLISIPLGVRKAVRDDSRFDAWTSGVIVAGYAIPSFLFSILLIVLFSGGRYFDLFPLRGLTSEGWDLLPWWKQILDYFWHITLPVLSMVIGGFAGLTMLTKNSFLDQIKLQYVQTARAKGLSENQVLYGHVFRNAMLIVIAGFPAMFIGILFTGALLIEVIFSLDGLGLLGYEAAINRDYPVMFAILYIFTLVGMLMQIIRDVMYTIIDPRIDFEARQA